VWWNLVEFGGMGLVPFHHILIIVKPSGLDWWNDWPNGIVSLVDWLNGIFGIRYCWSSGLTWWNY